MWFANRKYSCETGAPVAPYHAILLLPSASRSLFDRHVHFFLTRFLMLLELTRLRAEYLDMLKREQVLGLYSLEGTVCERVLNTLIETRFLYLTAIGPRPKPADATGGLTTTR
jgi:hypothetical protein